MRFEHIDVVPGPALPTSASRSRLTQVVKFLPLQALNRLAATSRSILAMIEAEGVWRILYDLLVVESSSSYGIETVRGCLSRNGPYLRNPQARDVLLSLEVLATSRGRRRLHVASGRRAAAATLRCLLGGCGEDVSGPYDSKALEGLPGLSANKLYLMLEHVLVNLDRLALLAAQRELAAAVDASVCHSASSSTSSSTSAASTSPTSITADESRSESSESPEEVADVSYPRFALRLLVEIPTTAVLEALVSRFTKRRRRDFGNEEALPGGICLSRKDPRSGPVGSSTGSVAAAEGTEASSISDAATTSQQLQRILASTAAMCRRVDWPQTVLPTDILRYCRALQALQS